MIIGFSSDHAGAKYRDELAKHIITKGHSAKYYGATNEDDKTDYPDAASTVADALQKGEIELAVVVCGSGIGISIALNKHRGIRCGIAYNDNVASLMKQHNNCNAICFGEREMTIEECITRLDIFINTKFEGGRHETRVEKIEGNING